jgi:uncharacterized protein (DUF1778 family)
MSRRSKTITLRISPEELESIDRAAAKAGMSRSDFMIEAGGEHDRKAAKKRKKALQSLKAKLEHAVEYIDTI